jgi:hypothetical protein
VGAGDQEHDWLAALLVAEEFGLPARFLSDNAAVARFTLLAQMRRKRRLRTATWALAAAILVSAGGLMAVGWYFTDQLLTPNHAPPVYNLLVHSVTSNSVELDRTSDTIRRGIWGLEWAGGHAIVGAVTATSETTVTRVLQRTTTPMHSGLRVVVSSHL